MPIWGAGPRSAPPSLGFSNTSKPVSSLKTIVCLTSPSSHSAPSCWSATATTSASRPSAQWDTRARVCADGIRISSAAGRPQFRQCAHGISVQQSRGWSGLRQHWILAAQNGKSGLQTIATVFSGHGIEASAGFGSVGPWKGQLTVCHVELVHAANR